MRNCKSLSWTGLGQVFGTNVPTTLQRLDLARLGHVFPDPYGEEALLEKAAKHSCIATIAANLGHQLRSLDVAECNLPDESVKVLANFVGSNLLSVDFSDNADISFATVLDLCRNSTNLSRLKLNGCHKLKQSFDAFDISDNVPKVRVESVRWWRPIRPFSRTS